MTYAANALQSLRDIPPPVLSAIVHRREYAYPVCANSGPLPDEVVLYLTTNPDLCNPLYDRPLYSRHFSATQLTHILSQEPPPKILETIIEYNTLTTDQLQLLSPNGVRPIVRDLLDCYAHDRAAIRVIASKISPAARKEFGVSTFFGRTKLYFRIDPPGIYNVPPELPGDLTQFCPLDASIAQTFTIAADPLDAFPLTQILGDSPITWFTFLRALDSAPPSTTLRRVASTAARLGATSL